MILEVDDGEKLLKLSKLVRVCGGYIFVKESKCILKEINQTDYYLVNLSSKTYVFEDKVTKY